MHTRLSRVPCAQQTPLSVTPLFQTASKRKSHDTALDLPSPTAIIPIHRPESDWFRKCQLQQASHTTHGKKWPYTQKQSATSAIPIMTPQREYISLFRPVKKNLPFYVVILKSLCPCQSKGAASIPNRIRMN